MLSLVHPKHVAAALHPSGCHAGVGNLLWDILATLGQSGKGSDTGDETASSLLLLGHPGVGQLLSLCLGN